MARGNRGIAVLDDKGLVLVPATAAPLRMTFMQSAKRQVIEGVEPLLQTSNYFVGNDPSAWRRGVRTFGRVIYREVYPGIDAVFHSGATGELEYDFIVHSRSNPQKIRLRFDGARTVTTSAGGELVVETAGEAIRMKVPAVYQTKGRIRAAIAGRYRILGKDTVGFVIGDYDRSRDLIIDPVVVGYSSFLGGTNSDVAFGVAVDGDRNSYIAGTTSSANFPTKNGISQAIAGGADIFLAKLNPAGDQILFSTFLGGSGDEAVGSITLDSRGDIYLSGSTNSVNFPVTEGAPQRIFGGGARDAYVAKLTSDGSRLLFSTFLGGEGEDRGLGVATDPLRNVYVGGWTLSAGFPVSAEALQTDRRGTRDGFVAKLRTNPPALIFSTYLGGSDEDFVRKLTVDAVGAAYVTGNTFSIDYPTTGGAFQTRFGGAGTGNQRFGDVFVTKIDPSGSSLSYSTYLGGLEGEIGNSIVVDTSGAAHVTGLAFFTGFPTTEGAYRRQPAGGQADVFLTKLTPVGDRLVFSTYLGGTGNEEAFSLALDPLGNVHLSGTTLSEDFPTTSDAMSATRKGLIDGFVSILSREGSRLLYSTFVGGTAPTGAPQENAFAVATDSAANTYVTGQTRSNDFPVTATALQRTISGLDDVFITKLAAQHQTPQGELRVVPVVGSTPGALGSFFKTSFQLHNPRNATITGRFIFHPQGRSGSDSDPSFDYFLGPGETIAISDLLPAMSQSGLGSVDLLTAPGEAPESVIRIFNDAGDAGTTGMAEEQIRLGELLQAGKTGVLIAPISTERARFDIGIRTLADGASLTITVRRSNGTVSQTVTRSYPAGFFEQRIAADFLGIPPGPNDSIALRIDSGSAVIYGSTTDNITQDPSLQLARAMDSVAGETRPFLLVVVSAPGAPGSFFKTSVQLHNPRSAPLSGRLIYHVQGTSGGDADPSLAYSLQPGETISYDDLLPAMNDPLLPNMPHKRRRPTNRQSHRSGLGSIDLVSTSGPPPLSVARIYNDAGERGTTGTTEDQVSNVNVLGRGDRGILLTPPDPAKAPLNIGIQALGEGATITMTIRTAFGNVVKTVTKNFDPVFFTQMAASALLETELQGNESVTLRIDSGSAIVYGVTTDSITQDPTLKVVRRLE